MNPFLIVLIVLASLLVLLLLLFLFGKASIRLTVRGNVRVVLSVLGLKFRIFPVHEAGDKPKSKAAKRKAAEKKRQKRLQKEADRANGVPTPNLQENIQMITNLVKFSTKKLRGKLSIRFRRFRIRIATGDAAKTAILYGSVLTATSMLLQWVDARFARISREDGDVEIIPDYLAERTTANIDIILGMRICRAVFLAVSILSAAKSEKEKATQKAARRLAKKAKRRRSPSKPVSK